jgi:hypothetical protein
MTQRFMHRLSQPLIHTIALVGLSTMTIAGTIVLPTVLPTGDGVAMAQDGEDEFTRYVRAANEISREQDKMMGQVKQLTEGNAPKGVCRNLDQVDDSVRSQVQDICNRFNRFLGKTLAKYKLSAEQYNQYHVKRRQQDMSERINQRLQELGLR